MNKVQTYISHSISSLALLAVVFHAHVASAENFVNPLGDIELYDFLLKILNALIYILFPVIVIMIVFTGFLFVAAQGNATKLQTARRALMWTVIGGLIILGSKAIALAIEATVADIQA